MTFTVGVPPGFRFRSAVLSHGWADLPPFRFDPRRDVLSLTLPSAGGSHAVVSVSEAPSGLRVSVDRGRGRATAARSGIESMVRSVFRLDADLGPFYREIRPHPEHAWMRRLGAGRLLRAPTVFEDAVKMICTTNCSWALTRKMVGNLCEQLGAGPAGARSFPTPEAMARRNDAFYRSRIRCGYRAPFLLRLARRVASGELDVERWRDASLPADSVRREIESVDGMGPYAAGNMLKLTGRYEELGIDSWCRGQYARLHRRGRRASDAAIERHYRPFGRWRGLVFWLDLTREWYLRPYEETFRS